MPDPQATTLQQKMVLFARSKMKQTVGGGECTDLVEGALRDGGKKTLHDLEQSDTQTKERDHNYVWGDPVAVKDARAGDILQFKDYAIETDTAVTVTFKDGTRLVTAS